jgi:RNA polymerase sigma-70 factor (ECF subfamily)
VWPARGRPRVVFGFTFAGEKIVAVELVADPERLRRLDLAVLDD